MEVETVVVKRRQGVLPSGSYINPEYVFHLVLAGDFTMHVEGHSHRVREGDLVVITPNALHAVHHNKDADMTVVHFHVRGGSFVGARIAPVISIPARRFQSIRELNRVLHEEWQQPSVGSRITCDGVVQAIFGLAMHLTPERHRQAAPAPVAANWRVVRNAVGLMHDRLTDPALSVAAVAEDVGVSYNHFFRLFRSYTNESPGRYIKRMRVDHAKELMFNATTNITESALQSGFGSLQSFSKVFRKLEGVSPRSWLQSSGR